LNQPELIANDREESAQQPFNDWGDYDFHFEEERKKRPRTPKRKKPYDHDD
jgi:hypothetical protein